VVAAALVVFVFLVAVIFSRVVAVVVSVVSVVSLLVSGVSNAVKLMVWFCPTTVVVVPAIVPVKAITTTIIMETKNLPYIGRGMQA
jgi:hypothetical protein